MAEDQGVNGDLWNEEASRLLKLFQWKQVGDSNIDVLNVDKKANGIDRLFIYTDVSKKNENQGFLLEAKRYKTTSFSKATLQDWIKILDNKLNKIKYSQDFLTKFPVFHNSRLNHGLIVLWFSNIEEYVNYRKEYLNYLPQVNLPTKRIGDPLNKIFVLDNYEILRLCSLNEAKKEYEREFGTTLKFYYPTSSFYKNPVDTSSILTIEYIFSKIILSEDEEKRKVVFYFGSLEIHSFKRLKSFLEIHGFFDNRTQLIIYAYNRDDEFRKIKPDVDSLFHEVKFEFREMNIYFDLPTVLKAKG